MLVNCTISLNGETVLKVYIHLFQSIAQKTTFLGYFIEVLKNYNYNFFMNIKYVYSGIYKINDNRK